MQKSKTNSSLTPWLIWGLAAFFFFSHYVVRVTPGQIVDDLQAAFISTTKYDIGILGAAFYLPYVIMQMPVGYLADKFGPRLLLSVGVLICSLSCFLFASATFFDMTIFSRILLGFCSATGFIGA
jgi:sugar phosphate permease